ncbi:MAG: flagellar assembly protein FliH [Alkalispirochaetaceae bacterium]
MARHVYRGNEVRNINSKVYIQPPERVPEPEEELLQEEEVQEYTGPTIEDIQRQAQEFKEKWDAERERMISEAKQEAERIVHEAEERAFQEIKKKTEEAQGRKEEAEAEADRIKQAAEAEAARIEAEANQRAEGIERDAFDRGYAQGKEEGYRDGKAEADRVVERLHVVLNRAIERRNEIIEESESQVVTLVLNIAKKVIKVISENQKNVVMNNVIQSLRKLKSKSDVIIRVNLADLKTVSQHKEEIIKSIERVGNITVAEDTTVDPGGAIVETDFGEIDARISSQLREIEDRILELMPISNRSKSGGG